jgi:YVTN family beta-propeller protein
MRGAGSAAGTRCYAGGWLPGPEASPGTPELRVVVLDALATLPPRARVVVVMRCWADLSVEQVADLLGCSAGSVKSQSAWGAVAARALRAGFGRRGARGGTGLYVTNVNGPVMVTAISTATNRAGQPVRVGVSNAGSTEAVTPDGRTVYVVNQWDGTVTPISTATNTAGRAIRVRPPDAGGMTSGIATTPDGRTAYALCAGSVIPIRLPAGTAGRPISVPSGPDAIVLAP